MKNKWVLVLLGILIVSAGCSWFKRAPSKITNAVTYQAESGSLDQPSDIPIPANFAYQKFDSIYLVDGNIRTGTLKYIATEFVSTLDVLKFYEERMPKYKWEEVATATANGKKIKVYKQVSGEDTCKISIYRNDYDKLELLVEVGRK
ncbi:MAG: hypothetical protein HY811_03645 [Planctomycetes bacterium]|nr:hypothetical protein [Planctomycetota bacterium]